MKNNLKLLVAIVLPISLIVVVNSISGGSESIYSREREAKREAIYEEGYAVGHSEGYAAGYSDAEEDCNEKRDIDIFEIKNEAEYYARDRSGWAPEEALMIIDAYQSGEKVLGDFPPTQEEYEDAVNSLYYFYTYFCMYE